MRGRGRVLNVSENTGGSNTMSGGHLSVEGGMMDGLGAAGEAQCLPTESAIKQASSRPSDDTMRSNNLRCL